MAFVCAIKAGEIAPGDIREVQVGEKTIAIANVGATFYAIDNVCLHRGGPLGQGPLDGTVVTCPWHGWGFDVTTGKLSHDPRSGVVCYPVEVRGEEVFVNI